MTIPLQIYSSAWLHNLPVPDPGIVQFSVKKKWAPNGTTANLWPASHTKQHGLMQYSKLLMLLTTHLECLAHAAPN